MNCENKNKRNKFIIELTIIDVFKKNLNIIKKKEHILYFLLMSIRRLFFRLPNRKMFGSYCYTINKK